MSHDPHETARKMDALDLWQTLSAYNFAVKPKGTVFPYFCTTVTDCPPPVKARFMMLEGWQTLHDYVRARMDHNFGFYSMPIEFPHLDLVVLATGKTMLFRHDTGYMPVEADAAQLDLAGRILWEAYGILLRLESDPQLPMRFASEQAIFARVETAPGVWKDAPLEIPPPPPHVETVTFPKDDLNRAKDVPFVEGDVLHVDFRLDPEIMTKEPRPRCVYRLLGFDPASQTRVFDYRVSVSPEMGLRGLWETMPVRFLRTLVERGRIPGQVKVSSARVFRLLRPLCQELPFRISLHDVLEV